MSTATDGRRREYQVRDHLTTHGWVPVMRAAASKGPADLLMGHPVHGAALIQVGSRTKTLNPADRARFHHAATLCSALALLAVVVPHHGITYYLVGPGPPKSWQPWTPEATKP